MLPGGAHRRGTLCLGSENGHEADGATADHSRTDAISMLLCERLHISLCRAVPPCTHGPRHQPQVMQSRGQERSRLRQSHEHASSYGSISGNFGRSLPACMCKTHKTVTTEQVPAFRLVDAQHWCRHAEDSAHSLDSIILAWAIHRS